MKEVKRETIIARVPGRVKANFILLAHQMGLSVGKVVVLALEDYIKSYYESIGGGEQ